MPTSLTTTKLAASFRGQGKSLVYDTAVSFASQLRVHANGEMPIHLIKKARPNESDAVRDYRESIYEPETQNPIEKVFGVIQKIRRSPDWMIRFDGDTPKIINENESLKSYLRNNYPGSKDIENWLFEEALNAIGIDANAVIAIIPSEFNIAGVDYLEPEAKVFLSKQVVDFVVDDYAILQSDELSSLIPDSEQSTKLNAGVNVLESKLSGSAKECSFMPSQVYYVITTTYYEKWEEGKEGKFYRTKIFTHGLNELPAFQVPGKFHSRVGKYTIKKTPLHPMVPHLNKAARSSNDLDAGVIQHLYKEKWRINDIPCAPCNGTGKKASPTGPVTCTSCQGSGMSTGKSPFNEIVIKPAQAGMQQTPTPPVGYVVNDPEIIKLQNEFVEQHLYKALASINMEFLSETKLNQSGIAKQYDRDDVTTLIYSFAESLCYVANTTIYFINELRYKNVLPNKEDRIKMLPIIPVPEKFDVINSSFLLEEYQGAKTAGLNSVILTELQKEIVNKKFYANPNIAGFMQTVMDLDPFPDKTIEEKGMMESQGLATKADVILSNYIRNFVGEAIETNPDFLLKKNSEKRLILSGLAKEKVSELSTAKAISKDIFNGDEDTK